MVVKCPKCGGNTGITVTALVDVMLSFDDRGEFEGSEPIDGNHEWDSTHAAYCDECKYRGTVADFEAAGGDRDDRGDEPGGAGYYRVTHEDGSVCDVTLGKADWLMLDYGNTYDAENCEWFSDVVAALWGHTWSYSPIVSVEVRRPDGGGDDRADEPTVIGPGDSGDEGTTPERE